MTSEMPPIEYATPAVRPVSRTLAFVLIVFSGVILVCTGGWFLYCILRLATEEADRSAGIVCFAGMMGMFAGIAFCGAGVIFYVLTRSLLRLTVT